MGLLSKAVDNVTDTQDYVKNCIVQYHKTIPSFHGIIVELSGDGVDQRQDFNNRIVTAVSSFGITIPLRSHRSMVLFPRFLDQELINQHLSKIFGVIKVFVFESDNPEGAFALAQPYC
ncbi:MAG: hypothetical protein LBT14_05055 [Treponema sp.]|jgi:hypothetical protein|nr:hypothetical protein [Treponema sp.]